MDYPSTVTALDLSLPRARATASPIIARGILQGTKSVPPPARVDSVEFLNYYHPTYQAGTMLAPQVGIAYGATQGELLLQIAVQAPSTPVRGRAASITAVVDTSLAMVGGGIEKARAALKAIVASLHPGDVLNVATSNTDGSQSTPSFVLTGPNDKKALKFIDALEVDGSDDLGGGLVNGYLAAHASLTGALDRLVLITAGTPPPGSVDLGLIASQAQQGILLVGVGVGPADAYDDSLLSQATYAGHGADVYLDEPDEADVILHKRFDEVMDVAASQVEIEVQVPVGYKVASFSPAVPVGDAGGAGDAGGDSAPIAADLGPGRPMIFRITLYACKPPDASDLLGVGVSYKTPGGVTPPSSGPTFTSVTTLLQTNSQQIAKASAVVAYADALSGLNADRIAYAAQLAGDAAFDDDPDFADPTNGIRALLAIEQQRVP